jgi:hypothetical protein
MNMREQSRSCEVCLGVTGSTTMRSRVASVSGAVPPIVLIAALVCSTAMRAVQEQDWTSLRHRTGWVLLGTVDRTTGEWGTQIEFEIVGKKPTVTAVIPKVGEAIRATGKLQVVVVGFRLYGERDRLKSPATRILDKNDFTDVVLTPGSQARIYSVSRAPIVNGLEEVWVRIGPK